MDLSAGFNLLKHQKVNGSFFNVSTPDPTVFAIYRLLQVKEKEGAVFSDPVKVRIDNPHCSPNHRMMRSNSFLLSIRARGVILVFSAPAMEFFRLQPIAQTLRKPWTAVDSIKSPVFASHRPASWKRKGLNHSWHVYA